MSEIGLKVKETREDARMGVYQLLCAESAGLPNSDTWARLLASLVTGFGEMPERLGLAPEQFNAMMARHFPGLDPAQFSAGTGSVSDRMDERQELRSLIMSHCSAATEEHEWLAEAVANGCMGGTHLWHDLGLWSRKDGTALLESNSRDCGPRTIGT